ncbi:MAG: CRISPR-associated endonuclease Cas2 [Anaerolineae bacterium]
MTQTMLYVIAYDISDDRRRTKVHTILSGFGEWTQYSLFECWLDVRELVKLRARLGQVLRPDEDRVRIYPLCAGCQARVETIGSPPPSEKITFIS